MWCNVRILCTGLAGLDKCLNVRFTACVDVDHISGEMGVVGIKGSDLLKLDGVNAEYFEAGKVYYFKTDDVKLTGLNL